MCSYWFSLSIFIVFIAAQEEEYYTWTENEEILSKCIIDYLKSCNDPYYSNLVTLKDIAGLAAKRFHGKSKKKKNFNSLSNNFYYFLRNKHLHLFKNHLIYEPLLYEMRIALISCIGDVGELRIPIFEDEPVEIANLLNYVLVDWPRPIFQMMFSRPSRILLRKYVAEALSRLHSALNIVNDTERFRYLLRWYWMNRAQYYFNGYDEVVPYLCHRYSLRHPFVHTYDNSTALFARNAIHLLDRNPQVSQEDYQRIMRIHVADLPGYGEYDVFSIYERNGSMRSAEYYFESHLDQFHRIIFFFEELNALGISSDEEDTYMGQLPDYVMPSLRILQNDFAYSTYLLSLRQQLKSIVNDDTQLRSARVWEEDLITLLNRPIQRNDPTTTTSATTPKSNQLKRKGSVCKNKYGKNFCKRPDSLSSREVEEPQINNEIDNITLQQLFSEDESIYMISIMDELIKSLDDFDNDKL